jgi:AraC-like DNA-binding protein
MNASSSVATIGNSYGKVVRFSTADYAPHERLEALHEIFGRNLQKVHVEPLAGEPFYSAVTLRRLPGLNLYTACRSAAIYRRSRELIEHDDVVFIAGFNSSYEVQHLGRTINMERGEAVVLTGAEPALFGGPAQNRVNLLRVPARLISPFVADLEAAYGRTIPANNPALRLLVAYLGLLEENDALAAPDVERQVASHIHDLMALAIGATREAAEFAKSRGARAARLRAIKEDIANALDQPGLSVATIAAQHRLKPRWVQRLFEGEGTTFTEYVLAQRLARAHRLLTDPRCAGLKISAIALDVGFGDLSYFNRAFRRRYGVAPSELRAAASAAGKHAPEDSLQGEVSPCSSSHAHTS